MTWRKLSVVLLALLTMPIAPGLAGGEGLETTWADPSPPTAPVEHLGREVLEQGLLDKLEQGPRGVIVHFDDAVPANLDDIPGIQPSYTFESIPAAYVLADAAGVGALSFLDGVTFVEDAWKPLAFHLDSATTASRAKEVYDPTFTPPPAAIDETDPTPTLPGGGTIDGAGVTIALVDSGLDATHPAFIGPGKVAGNYLVTPAGVLPGGPYTVQGDTHGTHMAGAAAGTGAEAHAGRDLRGAAPGASLAMFATWNTGRENILEPSTIHPAIAFDWIIQNGASLDPPIRVVANGWSCAGAPCEDADPSMAHLQLAIKLAEEGFVVLFAVGNDRGRGGENRVSAEARLPTPGIIGVTNHDDEEGGTRTDCIKTSASRGDAQDATTWPDLAAPGDDVTSTQAFTIDPDSRVPVLERKTYTETDGTSISTGHLAGVVALLLQANPTLTPAEVEYTLKATAEKLPAETKGNCPVPYVRADPSHPWDGANFAAGHGLVDAVDAVNLSLNFPGIPETAPELEAIPADFDLEIERVGVDVQRRLYLDDEAGFGAARPTGEASSVRVLRPNEEATFTSEPLGTPLVAEGIDAAVFVGVMPEGGGGTYDFFVPHSLVLRLERLSPDGEVVDVTHGRLNLHISPIDVIVERDLNRVLSSPISFEQEDRVRLTVRVVDAGLAGEQSAISNWILAWDSSRHPSSIGLGSVLDPAPQGSQEDCQADPDCTWIDADHPSPFAECKAGLNRLTFTGPPGSRAIYRCPYETATCEVPGDAGGPWGTCEAEMVLPQGANLWTTCTYTTPDGSMDGYGNCLAIG